LLFSFILTQLTLVSISYHLVSYIIVESIFFPIIFAFLGYFGDLEIYILPFWFTLILFHPGECLSLFSIYYITEYCCIPLISVYFFAFLDYFWDFKIYILPFYSTLILFCPGECLSLFSIYYITEYCCILLISVYFLTFLDYFWDFKIYILPFYSTLILFYPGECLSLFSIYYITEYCCILLISVYFLAFLDYFWDFKIYILSFTLN
jgi:hypothetical protein